MEIGAFSPRQSSRIPKVSSSADNTNERSYISTFPYAFMASTATFYLILLLCCKNIRLPLRFTLILTSSGMLRNVGWFCTDVSGLRVCSIFKDQDTQECWTDTVPQRLCETNLRCITSQKTAEFF
jgi:hypothetical protein